MHNKENLSLPAVQRHRSASRDTEKQADASSEAEWWTDWEAISSKHGGIYFKESVVWRGCNEWQIAWKLDPLPCK